MKLLEHWMAEHLAPLDGHSIPLTDVTKRFRESLTMAEFKKWPKSRIEEFLSANIEKVGRRDQPRKMLLGYAWPEIAREAERQRAQWAEQECFETEQRAAREREDDERARNANADRTKKAHRDAARQAAWDRLMASSLRGSTIVVNQFIEFAPGEHLAYAEVVDRINASLATNWQIGIDGIEAFSAWHAQGKYAGDRCLLDHRWCPLMLYPDGRLKVAFCLNADGTDMPSSSPDNNVLYPWNDPRRPQDPIEEAYRAIETAYRTRPWPPEEIDRF